MQTTAVPFNIDALITEAINIALGTQKAIYSENLSAQIVTQNNNNSLLLSELTKLVFAGLGIEIEFSGKGVHEKGVIIDMDETRLAEIGLNANFLRFGQTVVKVRPQSTTAEIVYLSGTSQPFAKGADMEEGIVKLIAYHRQILKQV
jgi:hypothetical protein